MGNLDAFGAYITKHEGRIFVITWPPYRGSNATVSSLYMSPPVPEGGLTPSDADGWTKVWQAADYEPDPLIASRYAGGALASFDGYLYWGTMHIPLDATGAFFNQYGVPENDADRLAAFVGHSKTSIPGKFDADPASTLYEGADARNYPEEKRLGVGSPNNMGKGPATSVRARNPFNKYTWSMAVGTTLGGKDGWTIADELVATAGLELPPRAFSNRTFGADLFYFPSSSSPALPESISGVGNYTSYGVRNILSADSMFLGMANPMNLLTDTTDDIPEGGWELIELARKTKNTPQGRNVEVELVNDATITFRHVKKAGFTAATTVPNPFRSGAPAQAGTHPLWEGFDLNGPAMARGATAPQELLLISSSADWLSGDGRPAEACVPTDDPVTANLFQLQFNSERGYYWKD